LRRKKAIWIGRKTDPYQPIENELRVTRGSIEVLVDLSWSFLVCSKYISNAERDTDLFLKSGRGLFVFLIEMTPGMEQDWEIFERKRTTPVGKRLRVGQKWLRMGLKIGIRGEPFIPGYHTPGQFRDALKRIKSYGFRSYNTYNLHMNDYTVKRLFGIGLDIEKIWEHNQDRLWRPIQRELCQIADEENVALGCPDFVNVPREWKSRANTCCGLNVRGAFTFNTHHWRRLLQEGVGRDEVIPQTWEGIGTEGDLKSAELIMHGKSKDYYTMEDAGL
jgi:hypothetical protein